MLIDPETGFLPKEGNGTASAVPTAPRAPESVPGLIQKALAGLLPRARQPQHPEPETLSPTHIQIILDRIAGYKGKELAEKYDLTPVHVSRILNHPDAEYLIGAIMGQMADSMTDPRKRLEGYVHEALNVKVELLRTSRNDVLRNRIASDFLDRAGYGAPQNINVKSTHEFSLDEDTRGKLSEALSAARRRTDFSRFLVRSGGGAESEIPSEESLASDHPHPTLLLSDSTPAVSASPDESSADDPSEEAA